MNLDEMTDSGPSDDGRGPSLAERLKAYRKKRGISRSQAARELDIARTAYRPWELEAAHPSPTGGAWWRDGSPMRTLLLPKD